MILITGVASSGTSWVAEMVKGMGADLGDISPNPIKRRGYVCNECRKLQKAMHISYKRHAPHLPDFNNLESYVTGRRHEPFAAAKNPWIGLFGRKLWSLPADTRFIVTYRDMRVVREQEMKRNRPDRDFDAYWEGILLNRELLTHFIEAKHHPHRLLLVKFDKLKHCHDEVEQRIRDWL